VLISNNSSNLQKVTYEVTREGIYELSEDDNTIVFVLDSFDDDYLDKIKKAVPDYKKKLEGFTEYDNTLASASGASIALPSILTGEVYTQDTTYNSYIEKIWSSDNVYSTLNKNKVDTRIFAQTEYFSADSKDYVDNIVDYMDTTGAKSSMLKTIYKYTAYTYMPHYLKEYFWLNLDTISSYKSKNIYSLNDAKFYADYVRAEGFSYSDKYTDSVRIYNLDGARSPYLLTKNTIKSINGTSLDEQIYGCFNCIFTMLDDLKENGKYKDANIIITANIGNTNLTQHPLMLIKEAGKDTGYTISHAPLSSFDLAPTLASLVTDDYSAFGSGISFFDVKEDDAEAVRRPAVVLLELTGVLVAVFEPGQGVGVAHVGELVHQPPPLELGEHKFRDRAQQRQIALVAPRVVHADEADDGLPLKERCRHQTLDPLHLEDAVFLRILHHIAVQ